jgi:hypothetical protein
MLAYQRGYAARGNGRWPRHKPPAPPDPVVRELLSAAAALRDVADNVCAQLDEQDDFVKELGPRIDQLDEAMAGITRWLNRIES